MRHFFAAVLVTGLVALLATQADSESQARLSADLTLAPGASALAASSGARGTGQTPRPPEFWASTAAGPSAESASSGRPAPTLPRWSHKALSTLLYLALCAVATAFVAVLAGPLERLTATRNT